MKNTNTTNKELKIVYAELSYKVVGACFKVHNDLGRYKNEKQYADALEGVFKSLEVNYEREKSLDPSFSNESPRRNVVDFLVGNKIILELKAKPRVTREDYYQLRRYLSSGNIKLGIIVNFRNYNLVPKRVLV